MRILITAIVTAIIVSAGFLLTARYKPEWLIRLEYDENGFPRIRKRGDKFIVNNVTYLFNGDTWIKLDANGFPANAKIGDVFINNNVSYTFTSSGWVVTETGGGGNGNQTGKMGSVFFDFPNERRAIIGETRIINGKSYRWICRTSGGQTLCGWTSI